MPRRAPRPPPSYPPFSCQPENSLRTYIRHSYLPEMVLGHLAPPAPNHDQKSHRNWLKVRYNPQRNLQAIYCLPDECWLPGLFKYTCFIINKSNERGNPDEDCWILAPAKSCGIKHWRIPETNLEHPNDTTKFSTWVESFILNGVERILHVAEPESADCHWLPNDEYEFTDTDEELIRTFDWGLLSNKEDEEMNADEDQIRTNFLDRPQMTTSCIAFLQPPWVLSTRDFRDFWRCSTMPSHPSQQFNGRHRLWARIYDDCRKKNCHWFIVSNYDLITYGCFSPGWSSAFLTTPMTYDCGTPTILQATTYWILSSMQRDETFDPTPLFPPDQSKSLEEEYVPESPESFELDQILSDDEEEEPAEVTANQQVPIDEFPKKTEMTLDTAPPYEVGKFIWKKQIAEWRRERKESGAYTYIADPSDEVL